MGRQLGLPSSTSSLLGAGLYDAITFLKENCCLCTVLLACFPLVVSCLRCPLHFSILSTKITEAGTKGDVSYLDAPDA